MAEANEMPKEQGLDHSFNFMTEGYMYILNRRRSFNSDVFETRLFGKKTICLGGQDATKIFYDTDKFIRKNAAPNRVVQTLFGEGGVQALDGDEHRARKTMFMSIMTPDELKRLTDITSHQWKLALAKWEQMDKVILYEETQELLCKIACQWAGVPVQQEEVKDLTKDLTAMFESPAALGPSHWQGRNARNRVETWLIDFVKQVRNHEIAIPENTALYKFSWQRNGAGSLLKEEVVAVEVINILRPIIAIAVYINFLALAIHHFPEEVERLKTQGDEYSTMFIQEVRRYYPFFPVVTALVKDNFTWNGYQFKKGTLTMLDVYGTNHDPKIWDNPELFNPSRFENWQESPFSFIPQGGGDYWLGHRCAGEWVTIEIMKVSLDYLVNRMTYNVPKQDLSYSMVSMPSIPNSKMIINNVKGKV